MTSAIMLFMSGVLLMLRLGPNAGSFPHPLNQEDETRYVLACQEGDMEARAKLIEHNLRLVAHIIKKYYTQIDDQDDLISIGTIGLIKGVSTYRSDKGVRLATYASKCIENEILMHFRGQRKLAGELSLSDSIDSDGDGNGLSLIDILAQEDDMFERVSLSESVTTLLGLIDKVLTEREAGIIKMRYGVGGLPPRTQREVAQICGISRSYVSRLEKKALEKLRYVMADNA